MNYRLPLEMAYTLGFSPPGPRMQPSQISGLVRDSRKMDESWWSLASWLGGSSFLYLSFLLQFERGTLDEARRRVFPEVMDNSARCYALLVDVLSF